jgi:hypothetical protein
MVGSEFLVRSAVLQVAWSILLGWSMLLPRQPWGRRFQRLLHRGVTVAHVDWVVLALVQFAAAYALSLRPSPYESLIAMGVAFGGWVNPVPYFLRAFGVDAFSFSGGPMQRVASALGLLSVVALTVGWFSLVQAWL